MSPKELDELRTQLDEMLERPSSSPYDPSLHFVVTTDASQYGIGVVLQQEDGNGYMPVEFMSRRLPNEKVAAATYERELFALREALDHWRHYLLGRHFKVYSDHETLRWLKTQARMTPKLTRWAAEIDQYDFELKPVKDRSISFKISTLLHTRKKERGKAKGGRRVGGGGWRSGRRVGGSDGRHRLAEREASGRRRRAAEVGGAGGEWAEAMGGRGWRSGRRVAGGDGRRRLAEREASGRRRWAAEVGGAGGEWAEAMGDGGWRSGREWAEAMGSGGWRSGR
ncbi:hypothetical protein CBR_g12675 [Chara braunii]|uniref:Reverse transcriptase RNase H-like domain-containing protein n=1 Tax=Chara braunii TaxID=69332 RepID=A0A388KSE0_CHABU|nr:hypothetical protein CBR_g12675 [Chara braunii]|eukprot:GBG72956.1 hypothetical protein CBR_g12675 [Chara braunii]